MRYRHPTATVALIILAAALAAGCAASLQPGADPALVTWERSLNVTAGQLDALFKTDYQNWQVIDPALPQWKGMVNALRVAAPPILNAANQGVKAYRAMLELRRTDPTKVTQEQLNALAADVGAKVAAAIKLGQQAVEIAAQWKGGA